MVEGVYVCVSVCWSTFAWGRVVFVRRVYVFVFFEEELGRNSVL